MLEAIKNFFTTLNAAEIALIAAFGVLVVYCLFAIPYGISILCRKKQPNNNETDNETQDVATENDLEDVAEEDNKADAEENNETALSDEIAEALSDANTEPEECETVVETVEEKPIEAEPTEVVEDEQPEEINEVSDEPIEVVEDTAVVDIPEEVSEDVENVEETNEAIEDTAEEIAVIDESENTEEVFEVVPEEATILEEEASDETVSETVEEPTEVEELQESEEVAEDEPEEVIEIIEEIAEVEESEITEELVEEIEQPETVADESIEELKEENEQVEETTELNGTEEVLDEQVEETNEVVDEPEEVTEVVPEEETILEEVASDEIISEAVEESPDTEEGEETEDNEVIADVLDQESSEPEQTVEDTPEENSTEPTEVPVRENIDISIYEPEIVDGFVIFNALKRSFLSRLIQASETNQNYYSEIKNRLLSHKKVHNRLSWGAESFRLGRALKAKMTIRGKTLCLFLALNPDEFDKNIYHQRNFGDRKKYADVPLMLRVRSPLGLKRALRLVDVLLENIPLDKKFEPVVYSYPYETDDELIEKDLIRRIRAKRFVEVHEDETVDEAVVRIVTETQSAQFIESDDEGELIPEEIAEVESEEIEFAELDETEDEEIIPSALEEVQKDEPEFAEESTKGDEQAPTEFETPVDETPEPFAVEDERAVGAPVIDNDEVAPLFVGGEEEETIPESIEQTDSEETPAFAGTEDSHEESIVPSDLENEETVAPEFAGFEEEHKATVVPSEIKQEESTAPEFAELDETEDEAVIPTTLDEIQNDEPDFAEESTKSGDQAPTEFETPVEESPETFAVEDERAVGAPVIDNDEVAPLFVGGEDEETIPESIDQTDSDQAPDFANFEEDGENVVPSEIKQEEPIAPEFAEIEDLEDEAIIPTTLDEIQNDEPDFAEELAKDGIQAPTEFETPVDETPETFVVEDERAVGAPVIDNDEVAPLFAGGEDEEVIPESLEQKHSEEVPDFAGIEAQGGAFAPSEIKGKENVVAPEFAGFEDGENEAPTEFDAPQGFATPEDKDTHPDTIKGKQHKLDHSEDINPEFAEGDESELPPDAFESIAKAEDEAPKTEETPKQKPVKPKFEARIGVPRGLYEEVPEEKKTKPKNEEPKPKKRVIHEGLTKEEQRLIAENEALLADLMESEEESIVNEENHEIVGVCEDTSEFNNFEMKLYNASNNIKYYYSEIKNTLLSYKKIKCKQSNTCESYRQGNNLVAKITLNGNKLRLHLALNPKDYSENVYNHYSMADKNAYKDVPLTLIVSKRSDLNTCAKLIQDAMASKFVIYLDKNREWVDYAALYTKKED